MIDLIILAIVSFFILKKLKNILGEEHDVIHFGYDDKNSEILMKEAEKIEKNENVNENEDIDLSTETQQNLCEICKKIDNFSLEKFEKIVSKILEIVIAAHENQDEDNIKKFFSKELCQVICDSFDNENVNHIILVALNDVNICDIIRNENMFEIIVQLDMEQINYTTDNNENIIEGDKTNIVKVHEKWHFVHDFNNQNSEWLISEIEEI